jgi:hypothetical protein
MSTKKVTLATVKSFIRKNRGALLIRNISDFDGMTDCVEQKQSPTFRPAHIINDHLEQNNLGIKGAWFVGESRDYFKPLNEPGMTGYNVYNCCGEFDLAIKTGE